MDTVVSIITAWKDLITKVFGSYPLAGAVVTLIAAGVFYLLHTHYRKGSTASNAFWVLFGWAIAVPLVGLLLNVGGEIYGAAKTALSFLWSALSGLYTIYTKHPISVLVLLALAVVAYFGWAWLRPTVIPSKSLRAVLLTLAAVAIAHLLSPLLDLFGGQGQAPKPQIPSSPASPPSSPSSAASAPIAQPRSASGSAATLSAASPVLASQATLSAASAASAASQAKP